MENKSLNVFNSRLVLASPETATDMDFSRIEGVIGHEYFHNWTGNRVTCRDWFQLTLKEGLTVFRDQVSVLADMMTFLRFLGISSLEQLWKKHSRNVLACLTSICWPGSIWCSQCCLSQQRFELDASITSTLQANLHQSLLDHHASCAGLLGSAGWHHSLLMES